MPGLKKIFAQKNYLKWGPYFPKINKYSLCAVDVFAKYAKVKRCKIKAKTFLHGFIETVN